MLWLTIRLYHLQNLGVAAKKNSPRHVKRLLKHFCILITCTVIWCHVYIHVLSKLLYHKSWNMEADLRTQQIWLR